MAGTNDALIARVEAVLAEVKAEQDVPRAVHHIPRSGRTVFIEVNLVVGPKFAFQTVAEQDSLRERIWKSIDLALEQTWLSIALTGDPRRL